MERAKEVEKIRYSLMKDVVSFGEKVKRITSEIFGCMNEPAAHSIGIRRRLSEDAEEVSEQVEDLMVKIRALT